jgi:proteasome activator subunit 4
LTNRNNREFDRDHNSHWGRLHKVEDVKIEWHGGFTNSPFGALGPYLVAVPTDEEISFILEILNSIVSPALDMLEALLPTASSWDGVSRNDFCRYVEVKCLCRCKITE